MIKSTFSKYLIAFVLIIFVSFLMLSGLITSMIKTYVNEDKEDVLLSTSETIAATMRDEVDIEDQMRVQKIVISTLINIDADLQVLIADNNGVVFLSTFTDPNENDSEREPDISYDLGSIDFSVFEEQTDSDGGIYLLHHGNLGGYTNENHIACAKEIEGKDGRTLGYVISLSSTARENNLISRTRRAVINSSVWVMLAAVIAIYFITERIIHPLRSMTSAAKEFAKGNFESRVVVNGDDEVAALGNAFNNMAESLGNLEKMRNSFLANISHDLRTPMTTISGFIDGINSGAIPPEKHEYYLGVISAEVHRLSRLVSQILDISRLESGDRKFTFEDFDVAEVARLILISFEKKIDDKRLDVEFDVENDSMPVHADKDAIYQVLYNLCHNAIKFSNEGGKFRISMLHKDGKVLISVFDEGQVIPQEDLPLIFDRFYKSDKSRGLDRSGVGLGLYICKTIIDAHGEEISVESTSESGTEFCFTLKEGEVIKRKLTQQISGV